LVSTTGVARIPRPCATRLSRSDQIQVLFMDCLTTTAPATPPNAHGLGVGASVPPTRVKSRYNQIGSPSRFQHGRNSSCACAEHAPLSIPLSGLACRRGCGSACRLAGPLRIAPRSPCAQHPIACFIHSSADPCPPRPPRQSTRHQGALAPAASGSWVLPARRGRGAILAAASAWLSSQMVREALP